MPDIAEWPVNIVDLGVIATLLISGVIAYARGFVRETLSLLAWAGAAAGALFGFPYAQTFAREMIPVAIAADFAAGIVLFTGALVILSLVTKAVSNQVRSSTLNALDRSLGFVFGLARGALLLCAAYIGFDFVVSENERPAWLTQSRTAPLVSGAASYLIAVIPEQYGGRPLPPGGAGGKPGAVSRLLQPPPKADPPAPETGGYGEDARSGIERLIETAD